MSQENLRLEPARSIIAAFGDGDLTSGIGEVSEITERDRSRVLRWMYPIKKEPASFETGSRAFSGLTDLLGGFPKFRESDSMVRLAKEASLYDPTSFD